MSLVSRSAIATLGLLLSAMAAGQTANYNQLIAQAQADLQAGNAAQALTESQKAIAAAPSRWEAYVVAGGALQMEQQYDKAVDDFTQALKLAPAAKQTGVKNLLEKCIRAQVAAQSAPAPSSTTLAPPLVPEPASEASVTQAEVVLWKSIQNSTNLSDFQAYLQRYPNGAFTPLARKAMASVLLDQAASLNKSGNLSGSLVDLRQACGLGNSGACENLGWTYELSTTLGNPATAAQFFEAACNLGDGYACHALGNLYEENVPGVTPNMATAAQFFRKGCGLGDPYSCCGLTELYEKGLGVSQDVAAAAQFRQRASTLGTPCD